MVKFIHCGAGRGAACPHAVALQKVLSILTGWCLQVQQTMQAYPACRTSTPPGFELNREKIWSQRIGMELMHRCREFVHLLTIKCTPLSLRVGVFHIL